MVYYEEKRKILIIPTGFGILAESGDCKDAIEEAFNSGWTAGYNSGVTQDCGDAIEDAYNSGYQSGTTDGYQDGYDDGYEKGQEDCPECSGGTSCNLENGQLPLGREWDGDDTITPSQGYDGFGSVRIYDNGYGDLKYDSGYTQGYNDGQGGTVALQDKSVQQNTNLVTYYPDEGYDGMRSIYVDATPVYSNGHTDGQNYARSLMASSAFTDNGTYTNPNGWSAVTVNVPQGSCNLVTGATDLMEDMPIGVNYTIRASDWNADGFSEFTVYDLGFGQAKYDSGYTAGLNACSGGSCNLQTGQYVLDGQFDGDSGIVNPDAGYDGFGSFRVIDNGYGQAKYDSGFTYGRSSFPYRQSYYKAGEDSVIKSFLAGNDLGWYSDGVFGYDDYGLVVAYYHTPISQDCVITGYDKDCDERWYDAFDSMSVDGGPWESPQLYYYLTEGWHQIRFRVKDPNLHYAFNHNFTPSGQCYMDALKAVSLPEASDRQAGVNNQPVGTFKMNNGIRILSSSLRKFGVYSPTNLNGNALSGATNLNIIISHYTGNENVDITSDVQSGILFYPAGKSSTHSSALSGWTKMELF